MAKVQQPCFLLFFCKKLTQGKTLITYGSRYGVRKLTSAVTVITVKGGDFNKPKVSYAIQKYTEIIMGRMQALELKTNDKEITLINLYGPNNDDPALFEQLEKYVKENDETTFIIGVDFNTVLNENVDKRNGRGDTHKRCRRTINSIIDTLRLVDIWRDMHPDLKQFTWHSHNKPPVFFCRLGYFLISDNLRNSIISSKHNIGYKSDHSLVSVNIDLLNLARGPGYFKLNNSLLLNNEYQDIIKKSITEFA